MARISETIDELAMSCVAVKDYPRATYSGFTKRLRPKTAGIAYHKYLAFYLRSQLFRKAVTNNAFMTLRASFNEDIFSFLNLYLPEYKEQVKIGDMLYSMEQKIQLNKRICAELEAMAKTLYNYWFTQFDFPDENGKPYRSSGGEMVWNDQLKREIPKRWDVRPLSHVISSINTGLNPRDNFILGNGDIQYLTVKNLTTSGTIDFSGCDTVDEQAREIIHKRSDVSVGDKVEYQKLYGMLYDRSIQVSNTNRISVYDELSTYFIAFHFRGTCLSLDEFNDLHGFHFEKDPTNFNIDHLISLCEYIENLLIAYQCVSLSYPYEYGNMPTNLINVQFYLQQISQVIEKIGYMQAGQNGLTIFVEKDPAAIAVAESEFIPESLSYRLISYNHYSMKGNLAEKKTTLLDLANLLEPQRTILERIDKTFSSDLFYTFNNFHIRHNNIDQLGTKYKKPVGDLSDEQLEYWYDEVYQMCLLAFMRLEHIDRKKKFDSLKSQIEGT